MNVSKLLIVAATILVVSCQNEDFQEPIVTPVVEEVEQVQFANVDERLWEYFESFENEAAQRGISIDLNEEGTSGEISPISDDGVAGTCQYNSHFNHVTVDEEFWNRGSDLFREFVIYHELGHCVLHRDHEESSFDNGICRSLMRSGVEDCRDAYTEQNRSYYLDELFSTLENVEDADTTVL
ncbi:hypothetical protein N9L92_03590 [Saprospiraceae bacterium]|nr:hypothetical protein [Saprospiraceae bacterium]